MSSGRKRPRAEGETQEENDAKAGDLAECPFQVIVIGPNPMPSTKGGKNVKKKGKAKNGQDKKRRRTEDEDEEDEEETKRQQAELLKHHVQPSPFKPSGKFKLSSDMDLFYQVKPTKEWAAMTRYNSFVLTGTKYFTDNYIRVANDSTIERQKAIAEGKPVELRKKAEDDWVARILEIRALDEHHVYARIYWMYWPDELPAGVRDGNKTVGGRQPYHGVRELVASNHMDIINVMSVTDKADVKQMFEEDDEEVHESLYWRQGYNTITNELSSLEPVCKCRTPNHPDKVLVGCAAEECHAWLHSACIIHEGLMKVYDRLGTDKPHESEAPRTEYSIDAKVNGADAADSLTVRTKDSVEVGGEGSPAAAARESNGSHTPDAAVKQKGRPRKSEIVEHPVQPPPKPVNRKPYKGLFEAALLLDVSPPMLEVTDLRSNVKGGEKKWQERLRCLICGVEIS